MNKYKICIKDYKDVKRGTKLSYTMQLSNATTSLSYYLYDDSYKILSENIRGLSQKDIDEYFIEFNGSYTINFLNESFFNKITRKNIYTIKFDIISDENLRMAYEKVISYIENVKRLDALILVNFKNVIIDVCDNLIKINKLNDEQMFLDALNDSEKVFKSMYESALKIVEKSEKNIGGEDLILKNNLLKKHKEIVDIYTQMFKDLDNL